MRAPYQRGGASSVDRAPIHKYDDMCNWCPSKISPKLKVQKLTKHCKQLYIFKQKGHNSPTDSWRCTPLRFSFGLLMRKSRSGTPRSSKRCGFNKASSKTRGSGLACSYKPMLYATVKCSHSRMTTNYIEVSTPLWIDRLYVPSQTNTCRS